MKILITGANGYIGAGIVKKLLDAGNQVIATDITLGRVDDRAIKIESNIFDIKNPYVFFNKPDILLHLAWQDGFVHESDSHILNLGNHYIFLKSFFASDINKIAIMGSMHEIGQHLGAVKDNTSCNPLSNYGIAKNALRQLAFILSRKYDKKTQWLRGFYLIDNSSVGNSVFSKLFLAGSNNEPYFNLNSGENKYDFLSYEVFITRVACAIQQDEILGIINICSGKPTPLKNKIIEFVRENNFSIQIRFGYYPERTYDSKAIWGDSKKIDKIMRSKR